LSFLSFLIMQNSSYRLFISLMLSSKFASVEYIYCHVCSSLLFSWSSSLETINLRFCFICLIAASTTSKDSRILICSEAQKGVDWLIWRPHNCKTIATIDNNESSWSATLFFSI
jgi:hypothetical protein